jgi:SOS-response transcriptional repressor LexA
MKENTENKQKNIRRMELNARFIAIYMRLEEDERIKDNSREGSGSYSKSKIAEIIFGKANYGHVINKYLSGERLIKYEEAKAFAALFGLNKSYLLDGVGQPFDTPAIRNASASSQSEGKNKILFAAVEAFASSAQETQFVGESEFFQIPGLQGDFIAFPVRGNSMQPSINQGDIVICRPLESSEQLNDNEIYAVNVNGAVMVKRVQRIWDKSHRKVVKLKLISDNYLEHDPIIEDAAAIHKYWKVEKKVTGIL